MIEALSGVRRHTAAELLRVYAAVRHTLGLTAVGQPEVPLSASRPMNQPLWWKGETSRVSQPVATVSVATGAGDGDEGRGSERDHDAPAAGMSHPGFDSSGTSTHGQVHLNCVGALVGSDSKCLCNVRKREAVRHKLRYGNLSAGNQIKRRLKIRRHAAIAVTI